MAETVRRTSRKKEGVNLDALGLEMGNKPPQALDVEEAVLGAMLVEPATIDESMEELTKECFYDPKHRLIFQAMSDLVTEHSAVDLITVSEKLRSQGNLQEIGGPVALAALSQKIGAAAHIEYYIKILKQKTIQRDLITASHEILKQSYDDSTNVDELIDNAQTKIFDAIRSSVKKDVQDQRGDGRYPAASGDDGTERGAERLPFDRRRDPGLAAFRPDHPCGPSFRRKDGFRPEYRPERRGRAQHAGRRLLPRNVRHPAGQASDDFRIRSSRR